MEVLKKKDYVVKCRQLISDAADMVQCPCCYENSESMVQCTIGHHICVSCMTKVNGICPSCQSRYPGTKCFVAQDLSKPLSDIMVLFDSVIDKAELLVQKNENYQIELKNLLIEQSSIFKTIGSSLTALSEYMQNPNKKKETDLQKELISLTDNFKKMQLKMNDLEISLTQLKNDQIINLST